MISPLYTLVLNTEEHVLLAFGATLSEGKQAHLFDALLAQKEKGSPFKSAVLVEKLYGLSNADPNYRTAYQAYYQMQKGLHQKLEDHLENVCENAATEPLQLRPEEIVFFRARRLFEQRQYQDAVPVFRKAIRMATEVNNHLLLVQADEYLISCYLFTDELTEKPKSIFFEMEQHHQTALAVQVYNFAMMLQKAEYVRGTHAVRKRSYLTLRRLLTLNYGRPASDFLKVTNDLQTYLQHFAALDFKERGKAFARFLKGFDKLPLDRRKEADHKLFRKHLELVFYFEKGDVSSARKVCREMLSIAKEIDFKVYDIYCTLMATNMQMVDFKGVQKCLEEVEPMLDQIAYHHVVNGYHFYKVMLRLFTNTWQEDEAYILWAFKESHNVEKEEWDEQSLMRNRAIYFYYKHDFEGLDVMFKQFHTKHAKKDNNPVYRFIQIIRLKLKAHVMDNKRTWHQYRKYFSDYLQRENQPGAFLSNHHVWWLRQHEWKVFEEGLPD